MPGFLFKATKALVPDPCGERAPDSFLGAMLDWARTAPEEIFALNGEPHDLLGKLVKFFGPWEGGPGSCEWLNHRKAAMLEHARVHAGFESNWRWGTGPDALNPRSMELPQCAEAGAFQASFDSLDLEHGGTTLRECARRFGAFDPETFQRLTKADRNFQLEYYFRLCRVDTRWAGPVNKGWTLAAMRADAIAEWRRLLAA
jgi:hypothetical protein